MSSQLQVSGELKIRDIQGPVVANSGVITALDGAASQYVRGDGTLADFPTSSGGGSSVSYYLNSSVSQGTIGGVAYRELSKDPIIGAGTDIAISANGYVANYITDANDPDVVIVPGGNFNCEFYFSVNNETGNPTTYAELYKYDGTTFTLLGSSVGVPESINQGTTIAPYYFAIPVATATLAVTDRLAIRIYVNVDGRTVTLHTENGHLCQVVTTLSKGMVSLNNLTDQSQFITTGTSGTDFNIVSSGDTHTFNIPSASASNRGLITTGSQTIAGIKTLSVPSQFEQGLYLKQNMNLFQAGYIGLGASTTGLIVGLSGGGFGTLNFNNTTSFTYTFPNATGTIALTSDLSSYVPYTGATANVDLGLNNFTAFGGTFNSILTINATGNQARALYMVTGTAGSQYGSGTGVNLFSEATDNLSILFTTASTTRKAILNGANLTTAKTFTLPDASGTIALTSNINYPVTSVFGRTGAVVAASGDYTTTQVTEGTNLYYTDARSRAALSFTAGSGAYNSTTGVITIPTDNNQIANGAGYITSSALSGYLPLSGGTLTGGLNGTTATFSGLGTFYQLTMTGATAGRLFYAQTGGVFSQSGNLVWNNTTEQLGVGTPNPSAVVTAFSTNAATQLKAAGTAPAITFSNTLTSASLACVFGLATANNHFITGTAAGDMAIANQSTSPGAIIFGTGTFEKMRMSSSGYFGIGTSSPNSVLEVAGTSSLSDFRISRTVSSSTYFFIKAPGGSPSASQLGVNGTDVMTLNASGNVGIGTTSPFSQGSGATSLEVVGSTFGQLYVYGSGGAAARGGFMGRGGGFGDVYLAAISNAPLVLGTNDTERLRITAAGNVGIGTSSPGSLLHLQSSASGGQNLRIQTSIAAGRNYMQFANGSGDMGYFGYGGANSNFFIVNQLNADMLFYTNDTERMRITSGGQVQIKQAGNTLNNDGLGLYNTSGNIWGILGGGDNNLYIGYNYAARGYFSSSTGVYINLSDKNKKKDFEQSDIGLQAILELKPTLYRMKSDETEGNKELGFIAQDVKEFIPQAFVESENFIGLNYNAIVAALVKSVQEQQAQIEELKELIKNK